MTRTLSFAACLLVAACAGGGSKDCSSDWFEIGSRDGRLGAEPQPEAYEKRCGTQIDRARYQEGWSAGNARRPRVPSF
jgi:hypothetical protein